MNFQKFSLLILVFSVLSLPLMAQDKSLIHQVKITTDKAPDTSSLKSICETFTKGLKTND